MALAKQTWYYYGINILYVVGYSNSYYGDDGGSLKQSSTGAGRQGARKTSSNNEGRREPRQLSASADRDIGRRSVSAGTILGPPNDFKDVDRPAVGIAYESIVSCTCIT